MTKTSPKAAKVTFWNELRIKNNLTIEDVADALHTSKGTVGNWFSGRTVPSERYLVEVCKLFDVDINTGYEEFAKATRVWDSERGRLGYTLIANPDGTVTDTTKPKKSETSVPDTQITESAFVDEVKKSHTDPVSVLLNYFYNKMSFEDYEQLRSDLHSGTNPLKILYGKISCEDYNAVHDLLD